MKKFSLLILSVLLLSCSSENEDAKEGNFLDVYNGVVWKHTDSENSEDNAWYVFSPESMIDYEIESTCVKSTNIWGVPFEDGTSDEDGSTTTVQENSKNLLIIKKVYNNPNSSSITGTLTVSENGNVITASTTLNDETEIWNKVSEPCK